MRLNKTLSILLLLLTLSVSAFSQDCNEGPGLPGQDPDLGPCEVPLDTWVIALVIAAVIYGTYKLYQKQKALSV
jgi:hypothetical protein